MLWIRLTSSAQARHEQGLSAAKNSHLSAALNRYRYANQDVTPRPTSSKTPPKIGSLFTASMTPEAAQMATNLRAGVASVAVADDCIEEMTLYHATKQSIGCKYLHCDARGNADGDDSGLLLSLLPFGLDGLEVVLSLHDARKHGFRERRPAQGPSNATARSDPFIAQDRSCCTNQEQVSAAACA